MAEPVGDTVVDPPADDKPVDPPADQPRTFSQDDVDRIVKDRVARAKATPPADYEELKAAASKLAELEESQKTELQKEREAREKSDEERDEARAEALAVRIRVAILTEAAKPDRKVVDPDLVATLLGPELEFDDDGDPTNVAKAMDSLLEARPYLVVQEAGTRGSADQGARQSGGVKQVTDAELQTMRPEAIEKARKEGRLNDLLGVR